MRFTSEGHPLRMLKKRPLSGYQSRVTEPFVGFSNSKFYIRYLLFRSDISEDLMYQKYAIIEWFDARSNVSIFDIQANHIIIRLFDIRLIEH